MGVNDTESNRENAARVSERFLQVRAEQADFAEVPTFKDKRDAYTKGFEDGSIWLADSLEPTRKHTNSAVIGIAWQVLVIYRDVALASHDFERATMYSHAIQDMHDLFVAAGGNPEALMVLEENEAS